MTAINVVRGANFDRTWKWGLGKASLLAAAIVWQALNWAERRAFARIGQAVVE